QCESNFLGISNGSTTQPVGSGGWLNVIQKYFKAKEYCARPFETATDGVEKKRVFMRKEWIGDRRNDSEDPETRRIELHCRNAAVVDLEPESLDAVLTDP